jgi:hypothetical protein
MSFLFRAALVLFSGLAVIAGVFVPRAAAALITATGLSSFEGQEEPTVIYKPPTNTFSNDTFTNIVDEGGGMIKFQLRYNPTTFWDGDRSTDLTDRQRAEIKGLGVHQKNNQTFQYTFDFRTDPNFIGTNSFLHIFQLKATDGDNSPPLVTLSLYENGKGALRLWSGTAANSTVARSFTYTIGQWIHADIKITTSITNTGSLLASINGDPFAGMVNVPAFRPDATDYRPKWGFYRGINSGMFVGTNYIEEKNITAQRLLPEPASGVLAGVGVSLLAAGGCWRRKRSTISRNSSTTNSGCST